MDTIGFFTSEEKKLFFSKYRLLLRNLYSFLEREDIRKMKELMKRVVALDCYGRDKNGINGLLRNIDTALIATLEIGLKRTSVIALLLYRPVLKKAITIEEVEQKFGADVTLIIRRLLKTSDLYARNTAVNSENFHHLLFSFAEDVRVILLMIADRLCKIQRSGTKYDRALVADLTQTACYINAERRVHQNIQQNNIKPSAVPKLIIERFTAVVHFAGIVNRMCIAVMTEKIRKDIPF